MSDITSFHAPPACLTRGAVLRKILLKNRPARGIGHLRACALNFPPRPSLSKGNSLEPRGLSHRRMQKLGTDPHLAGWCRIPAPCYYQKCELARPPSRRSLARSLAGWQRGRERMVQAARTLTRDPCTGQATCRASAAWRAGTWDASQPGDIPVVRTTAHDGPAELAGSTRVWPQG